MTDITMPRLADGMEQGTIVKWLVADGDHVETGADLVEIETDKATLTHVCEATGTVRILAAEGDTIAVGAAIAQVGDEDAPRPEAPVRVVSAGSGNGDARLAIGFGIKTWVTLASIWLDSSAFS